MRLCGHPWRREALFPSHRGGGGRGGGGLPLSGVCKLLCGLLEVRTLTPCQHLCSFTYSDLPLVCISHVVSVWDGELSLGLAPGKM